MATLRGQLSSLLEYVAQGREIEVQKRNISIARIVPIKRVEQNRTKLGSGKGSVKFLGDVTAPVMIDDWEMNQ